MIHPNSIEANEIPDKAKQKRMILFCLEGTALTRNEIAAITKLPLSSVTGRISEMKDAGILSECGNQIVTHQLTGGGKRRTKRALLKIAKEAQP